MKLLTFVLTLLTLVSCSSYVQQMHNQMDREMGLVNPSAKKRNLSLLEQRELISPALEQRGNATISSSMQRALPPATQRRYSSDQRRYKASDLIDNDNSGSLWAGNGENSFLFSRDNYKRAGDIVTINVFKNLKDEISLELARTFPTPPPPKPKNENQENPNENQENPQDEQANANDPNAVSADPDKIYDRISSVVVEEVNKDHLILKGRKDLIYKNAKRTVEVQVIASRKDIGDDDSLQSTKVLESSIIVLR